MLGCRFAAYIQTQNYTHEMPTSKFMRASCPCNVDPLVPHFSKVKLGFTGVYIFLIFALKHIFALNIECGF